jgi:hypothetical protein
MGSYRVLDLVHAFVLMRCIHARASTRTSITRSHMPQSVTFGGIDLQFWSHSKWKHELHSIKRLRTRGSSRLDPSTRSMTHKPCRFSALNFCLRPELMFIWSLRHHAYSPRSI